MSLTQNRWFRRLGYAAIAALSLGALAMPTAAAQARPMDYRAPVVAEHHAAYFPRFFFGFGHGYQWHHWDQHRR